MNGEAAARRIRLCLVERRSSPEACSCLSGRRLIVKWDLDNQKVMKGEASKKILELIRELESEGLL